MEKRKKSAEKFSSPSSVGRRMKREKKIHLKFFFHPRTFPTNICRFYACFHPATFRLCSSPSFPLSLSHPRRRLCFGCDDDGLKGGSGLWFKRQHIKEDGKEKEKDLRKTLVGLFNGAAVGQFRQGWRKSRARFQSRARWSSAKDLEKTFTGSVEGFKFVEKKIHLLRRWMSLRC